MYRINLTLLKFWRKENHINISLTSPARAYAVEKRKKKKKEIKEIKERGDGVNLTFVRQHYKRKLKKKKSC